jgi:hypothetical protein
MDVTPVGAIGSGRSSRRAEVAGDNDYDRAVRIARQFRDAEADRRRRREPPPSRTRDEDEPEDDEPRAGVELDTYL